MYTTCNTPLHPLLDGMMEHYIKTVGENFRKLVSSNKRDWDERLPEHRPTEHPHKRPQALHLLGWCSGRSYQLSLPFDPLFRTPHTRSSLQLTMRRITWNDWFTSHHYAHRHLKAAWDRIRRLQSPSQLSRIPGRRPVLVVPPDLDQRKSLKLQSYWQGPIKVVTQINNEV